MIDVYPSRAAKTKKIQVIIQAVIDESPSTFGDWLVIVLKMLIKTRKRVTSNVIRPATISTGIKKPAYNL